MDDTSNRYQPSELRRVVRQPLTDTTTQVNNSQSKQQQGSADQQKSRKSVHQDLSRKATVNGLNSQFHQTSSPGHARLSTGLREPQQESNRNSQVSQASTNVSGKSRRKVHIGPWVLGKTLGRGASARVRKARHALTGQIAAVKIVSKVAAARAAQTTSLQGRDLVPGSEQDPNRQMPFGIEREVVILKLIEHSHIVSLYDVWENRGELYMVMEYVDGGNMLEYLTGVGLLSESEAVRYFRQMLSALGYCHAFGICHRDLKLENLLIDSSMNLKIADFGFAALQPDNVLLRTSCGSPSYAAPEIINGELYRGDTADIWSCGVILYAFLGGDLPFAADDVQEVLVLVKRGRYRMPKHLSKDAKDLIWWLLQLSPKDRIKIHQIWQHTLIRKYDIVEHDDGTLEQYAGPSQLPIITNYVRPRSVADIDREIFRNLHTLWHTEEPELLAHQLMNEEYNQEKFFYCLLLKYREDRREDFQGVDFEISASDYHHDRKPGRGINSRRTRLSQSSRYSHRSRYSIATIERERPSSRQTGRTQTPGRPGTSESYDPFRPSSSQAHGPSLYSGNPSKRSAKTTETLRHPAVVRLSETEGPFTPSLAVGASSNSRTTPNLEYTGSARFGSRRSIASTGYRSSPPIIFRPSSSHKRGVSFDRTRRASIASPSINQRDGAKSRNEGRVEITHLHSESFPMTTSERSTSLMMDESPYVRSRKPVMMSAGPLPAIREGRPQSHLFGEEARQVSSELGRFCEEVFKSTVSLYDPTSEGQPFNGVASQSASRPTQRDLPFPATVWSRGSHQENSLFSWQERPLPAPPVQGRDSFTEELRATRDRLQQRSAQGAAGASQGYLDEVIAHLDKLMQPSTASQGPYHDDRRRVASATADCKSPAMTNRLPAIREEYRISGGESYGGDPVTRDQGYRTASAPISYWLGQTTRENRVDTNETIRLVEQDEMVPSAAVPPLNVKKKSERSSYGESDKRSVSNTPGAEISSIRQSDTEYRDLYHAAFQNDITQESSYTKREPKSRLGWFKRGGASRKEDHKAEVNDREALATPDETAWFTNTNKRRHTRERPDLQAEEEESRRLKLSGTGMKKGGFFNIFSRRDPAKRVVVGGTAELRVGTPDIDDAMSISTSVTSTHRLSSRRRHRRKGSGNLPQRNWLARILHIKPASQIFCFTTSKVRARREVASVLRDWRRYGLKDIMVNKQRNMISGRVDVQNFLHIKPVTFTCTFHTVLEKGRPRTASPLSIARFRQEKGAASSFLKVVQTLENYLTRRDVLVVDRNKCRAMEKVYGDYLKG